MNRTRAERSACPDIPDPNRLAAVFQVLYIGPAKYDCDQSDKNALYDTVREFSTIELRNSQIVKIRPSYLLGCFLVWTKTRESAQDLPWHVADYERRYEVLELRPNAQNTDYVPVEKLNSTRACCESKGV